MVRSPRGGLVVTTEFSADMKENALDHPMRGWEQVTRDRSKSTRKFRSPHEGLGERVRVDDLADVVRVRSPHEGLGGADMLGGRARDKEVRPPHEGLGVRKTATKPRADHPVRSPHEGLGGCLKRTCGVADKGKITP